METITNTHNQHVSFFTTTFEWQKPETNVTSIFGGLWFKQGLSVAANWSNKRGGGKTKRDKRK